MKVNLRKHSSSHAATAAAAVIAGATALIVAEPAAATTAICQGHRASLAGIATQIRGRRCAHGVRGKIQSEWQQDAELGTSPGRRPVLRFNRLTQQIRGNGSSSELIERTLNRRIRYPE